jgi:hypothetical protein
MSWVSQQAENLIQQRDSIVSSVRIRRISAELTHSTELELGKLRRTQMDFGRASVLDLRQGLPTRRLVLRPSKPHLSLYYTKIEFGSPLGEAKPHFLHTFYRGEHRGIYRRGKMMLWLKIGCIGPVSHATWLGDQVSSLHLPWALDTLSTAFAGHVDKMVFGNEPTHGRPAKVMWPAGHTLARLSPCFVPCHFLVSYFL